LGEKILNFVGCNNVYWKHTRALTHTHTRTHAHTHIYEPCHDKTNIMRLRPACIQTSLRVRAVWSGSMLFICCSLTNSITNTETDSEQHGSWPDCADAQAGLDPCWLQTHYVGFVMTRLIYIHMYSNKTTKKLTNRPTGNIHGGLFLVYNSTHIWKVLIREFYRKPLI
jgi:hypothetical protein